MNRYHRQILLPQIGEKGQERVSRSRVLLIGCGALGSVIAEQLVRAGVGFLRICDRDLVEPTNLQRQVLFDEADAAAETPKVVAAVKRLRAINSTIELDGRLMDVHSGNIEELIERMDLILDGTDNVETRYLINDVAVKHSIPWVYGACVGMVGRVMGILPGTGPCLRCVFEQPASAGELETCETAGVLGSASGIVASMQVVTALKILLGRPVEEVSRLITLDVWEGRCKTIECASGRRADCPACGRRHFEFLDRAGAGLAAVLCGRGAVQVRPAARTVLDLDEVQRRLSQSCEVRRSEYFLRCRIVEPKVELTVFPDGRALVHGTGELSVARSVYARYIGT
jgi:molybdopterin/thiamine biosynthesis adenylyltransferase